MGTHDLSSGPRAGSPGCQGSAPVTARAGAHAEVAGAVIRQPAALRHGPLAPAPLWRSRRPAAPDLGRRTEIALTAVAGRYALRPALEPARQKLGRRRLQKPGGPGKAPH